MSTMDLYQWDDPRGREIAEGLDEAFTPERAQYVLGFLNEVEASSMNLKVWERAALADVRGLFAVRAAGRLVSDAIRNQEIVPAS